MAESNPDKPLVEYAELIAKTQSSQKLNPIEHMWSEIETLLEVNKSKNDWKSQQTLKNVAQEKPRNIAVNRGLHMTIPNE